MEVACDSDREHRGTIVEGREGKNREDQRQGKTQTR